MVDKIVLNDGTEIKKGRIAVDFNKQILVIIPGTDIVQATLTFSDPNKTEKMEFYRGITKTTYNGYTSIKSMSVRQEDNETNIYMIGENGSVDTEFTVPDIYLPEEFRNGGNSDA